MQNAWELQHTESVSPTFGPSMNDGRTSAHADNINSHNQLGIDSPETRNQRLSFGELLERSISAPPSNDNRDGFGGLIRGGIGVSSNTQKYRNLICEQKDYFTYSQYATFTLWFPYINFNIGFLHALISAGE